MRPTTTGEALFEGYACDYHKATLRSYSSIAPPMVGRYEPGQAYLAAQGRVFVVRYAYGEAANWQDLEDAARQAIGTYRYTPYGSGLYPCPCELATQAANWPVQRHSLYEGGRTTGAADNACQAAQHDAPADWLNRCRCVNPLRADRFTGSVRRTHQPAAELFRWAAESRTNVMDVASPINEDDEAESQRTRAWRPV